MIAEVAERSGFTPSTLRYYEALGLMPAATRTIAGYRLYDDTSLARLAFISRAKQLGCTLEEISDLTAAWEADRCEPIQARLRDLVAAKITETQERVSEAVAFVAQLQQAAFTLSDHTPDGPCDEDCGCASPVADGPTSVPLVSPSR
jgi:DNA-binding transcriptional MerR regulator